MKGPTRLREQGDLERSLLQSARADAPPRASRLRALTAVSLAATATTTSGAAPLLALATSKLRARALWLAPIAASVLALLFLLHAYVPDTRLASARPRASMPTVKDRPALEQIPEVDVVTLSPDPPVARATSRIETTQPPQDDVVDLARELALLESAKRALANDDTAGASRALDRYEIEIPHGRLAQEQAALRVRALVRSGDRARALARYEELAAAEPTSPHLESLRELLGLEEP